MVCILLAVELPIKKVIPRHITKITATTGPAAVPVTVRDPEASTDERAGHTMIEIDKYIKVIIK